MNILKRSGFIVLMILMALCSCCERKSYLRFGFDSPFSGSSDGLVIMYAGSTTEEVYLYGNISVSQGALQVRLIAPDGREAFCDTIASPRQVSVFNTYEPQRGNWRLMYQSLNGEGMIRLHISAEE